MNFFGYYVLNLQPTILAFIGVAHPPPQWLHPQAVLEHIPWWHGTTWSMLRRKYRQLRHRRTGVQHSLMVHAPDEEARRRILRVNGAFISQNIYIDKDTFQPDHSPKTYDSIYIAQLRPFKRHHLAHDLERVLLVAADLSEREKYQAIVPNASFNERPLTKPEVAAAINSAACSLALSKVEGGMLASFESLLCGVPVVSTRSKGGRDVFLDTYNSAIVDPTAQAVARAVQRFQANRPDPQRIRAKALADLEPHKTRFCRYVSDLAVSLGGNSVHPQERYHRYFDGPGGLSQHFIWADKFDRPADVERINSVALRG